MRLKANITERVARITRTRLAICLATALIAAVIISVLFSAGFYSNIQLKLSDFLYGGREPISNIAIVAIDDRSIQEIGRWPWERGNFTELLGWLDESKAIGIDVAFFETSDSTADDTLAKAVKLSGKVVMPVEYTKFEVRGNSVTGKEIAEPITQLRDSAALGYINIITDGDGITRAVNFNIEGKYEPFANVVLKQYLKKQVDKDSRMLINYIGKPGAYRTYSFSDVIAGKYGKGEFRDKIVLVGSTAPDLHDDYFVPTSYGKAMPGVEIHANIIQQLLTGKGISVAPQWLTIIMIFMAAIIVALLVLYLPVWLSAAISGAIIVLYTFVTIFTFNAGVILNIIYIPVTAAATYTATMIYFYISEKRSRKKVLGAFEKYVSKEVIKHILEHPSRLKLGGERREITIFFSDIRGFTTISEKLTPEQLVKLLNEYLSEMTTIILKNNGVVDKYMGDAIMAFWNAPIDQPKHAELACASALEMEKRLKELQKRWEKEGIPKLDMGIGLNTGPAVIGNMGSYDRFDYTAMGDTVNLGSRLEGLNKQYGTRIIISESTMRKVEKRPFVFRKIDMVMVKGKKEPITIYELVSRKQDAESWHESMIAHFEKGLEHYFKQDWDKAIAEFTKADKLRKGDGPSKAFIERCGYMKHHSPGKEWDGVWVMKTK